MAKKLGVGDGQPKTSSQPKTATLQNSAGDLYYQYGYLNNDDPNDPDYDSSKGDKIYYWNRDNLSFEIGDTVEYDDSETITISDGSGNSETLEDFVIILNKVNGDE